MIYYLIAVLFNGFFTVYFFKNKRDFFYILPIFVVLSDALSAFLPLGARGGNNYLTMFVVALFVFSSLLMRPKILRFSKITNIMFIYLLLLIILSVPSLSQLLQLFKFMLGFYIIAISYHFIQNNTDIIRFNKSLYYCLIIFILNFIFVNIFSVGDATYGYEIYGGSLTRESSFFVSIIILLYPIFSIWKPTIKRKYRLVFILSFLVLLFQMRRSPIVVVVFGLSFIFFYLSIKGTKMNPKKILLLIISVVLILSFSYIYNFLIEIRQLDTTEPLSEQIEGESRTIEVIETLKESLELDNLRNSLIGYNPFSQAAHKGKYAFGKLPYDRTMHTTLALMLRSTGLIGVVLMTMFFIILLIKFNKMFKYCQNNDIALKIKSVFIIFILVYFANLYTMGIFDIKYSIILFSSLGIQLKAINKIANQRI
jgi:hypothetical protein